MASVTIRDIDDQLTTRLAVRAASHGRSVEDEARDILRAALSTGAPASSNIAATIRARLAQTGGVTLEPPSREPMPEPVDLGG